MDLESSKPPSAGAARPSKKSKGDSAPLSPAALGLRIRALRKSRQLTVEALGELVGVHKTHLSRIERGLKAPSLTMISKLANSLGCGIGHLVGEVIHEEAIVVSRGEELHPRFMADEQHQFAALLQDARSSSFGAFILYPGTSDGPIQAQHEGHELLYVLTGSVDIHFQDRVERLRAGDCIHFPGYLTHRIVRVGRAKASALLVMSAT
jgi:transcriptional regulator with XRE-family HTH domain